MSTGAERQTLDALLDAARARITRHEPVNALAAVESGALLIDIRSDLNRERDGVIPGSLHIPRTVLEWRLEPSSKWRNPHVGDLAQQIILICDHGCSSILAAATLVELGFERSGDVIGGFAAWRDTGLPTMPAGARDPAGLSGMSAPES